ncbi:DUF2934 domain-containing protein [uncultured Caballeronia sp.]|uniref:DUF2934 domain-containing protein n=1 Tax=uncultured Caballeronia sp. TaxID=1827198 RepID=UPI0035CC7C7C
MENHSIEERIREKAYSLWLADGAMEGCADEYWRQAREAVENEIACERLNGGGSEAQKK